MRMIWQRLRGRADHNERTKLPDDIRASRFDMAQPRWSGARPDNLLQRLATIAANCGLNNIREAPVAVDEVKSGTVIRAGVVKKAVEQLEGQHKLRATLTRLFETLQAQSRAQQPCNT